MNAGRFSIVGTSVHRVDGADKVTGKAKYAGDLIVPGMIEGKFLRSPYAHARIRALDTREAEVLPGVVAVLSREDFTDIDPYIGRGKKKDQPIIALDRVIYAGQPVAAVAALDRATAEEALSRIHVEYEELPAVIEIDEAIAGGAPRVHDFAAGNICATASLAKGDIAQGYDASSLDRKAINKAALQRRLNLEVTEELPLLGFIGRLTGQKGADLVAAAANELAALPAQLAVLGRGEREIESALATAAARHPGRVAVAAGFDEALAHLIEAGADIFLMPSRFEPCGLNQMYSQRYGTPPVARATGGLVDTIEDGATGFLFERAEPAALAAAARRAIGAWREPPRWRELQRAGMGRDFSWPPAARRYAELYSRLAG